MAPKKKNFIESSQFGSLPPKVVVLFIVIVLVFVFGTSIAYKFIEDWSFTDAFYFAIITISTVGYGDVIPTTPAGRALNVIFTLTSFCGIFLLFRVIIGYVVDHQIALIVRRIQIKKRQERKTRSLFGGAKKKSDVAQLAEEAQADIKQEGDEDFVKTRNLRWIIHAFIYILWLFMWTMFYTWHPKEDFKFFQALYFGVITSTTIGYGSKEDGIPRSDEGKVFCLITTMLGTLSLAILAGSLSQGLLAVLRGCFKKADKHGHKKSPEDEYQEQLEKCLELPKSGGGKLDRFDFVCEMLVSGQKCKKKEIQKLIEEFDKLDINGDGVLDEKDFEMYKQETLLGDGGNGGDNYRVEMANIESGTYEEDIGLR